MLHTFTLTPSGLHLIVDCPYNAEFVRHAQHLNGRWSKMAKTWRFDLRDEPAVREALRSVFGTDGNPADMADLVTVRTPLWRHERENGAWFAGVQIAYRPGRFARVILRDGVTVVAGMLPKSGGRNDSPWLLLRPETAPGRKTGEGASAAVATVGA